jgi:hypothetical protein
MMEKVAKDDDQKGCSIDRRPQRSRGNEGAHVLYVRCNKGISPSAGKWIYALKVVQIWTIYGQKASISCAN